MFSNERLLNRKGDRNVTILESIKFCSSKQKNSYHVFGLRISHSLECWSEGMWRAFPELPAFIPEASPTYMLSMNNHS